MNAANKKSYVKSIIAVVTVIILSVSILSFVAFAERIFNNDEGLNDAASNSDVLSFSDLMASDSDIEAETETAIIDTRKNINEYIKNPDYKSDYYIVVYTLSQSVVVYKKDSTGGYNKLYKRVTCSTGKRDITPTREGVYSVIKKYRWVRLMGGVYGQYSSAISDDYLFHSVPYSQKDPSTLSESAYDQLGNSASHGCIRLCVRDAKWIYDHIPIGTQVNVVWAKGPYGVGVPKRNTDERYKGWDPTDKWSPGNPYFTEETTSATTTSTEAANSTSTTATPSAE